MISPSTTRSMLVWGLTVLPLCSAIVIWDNEATLNGGPNTSWFAESNWSNDVVPGSGDEVRILSHGDLEPVELSATSATVLSLTCRVPFALGSTLTVLGSSEFENSLLSQRIGTIRANGLVTFKGSNNATRTTLEGSTGFQNDGTLWLASRPVSATFLNSPNGLVSLTANVITLSNFANAGILQLGPSGDISSSSSILNTGTITKDDATNTSEIAGNLEQVSGLIEVTPGTELSISGLVQEFKGGSVNADGLLRLTSSVGGTPTRTFNGLTGITGSGSVDQVRSYEVAESVAFNLSSAPGYQAGDLSVASGKAVTNQGHLTFSGTETIETSVGNPLSASFLNPGTIHSTGNPLLDIYTLNSGTWNSTSLRIGSEFENSGTLELEGSSGRISSINSGYLINSGITCYDPANPLDSYEIAAPFHNESGAELKSTRGRLTLSQPSPAFGGTVEATTPDATIRFWGASFDTNGNPLTFQGQGLVQLGDSGIPAAIHHPGDSVTTLVGSAITTPPATGGFLLRNGSFTGGDLSNGGTFRWQTGTITTDSRFLNLGTLILESSGLKNLTGDLEQNRKLYQLAPLRIDPASTLTNHGDWQMQGLSSHIHSNPSSTDPADFKNFGSITHSYTGASSLQLDFVNRGFLRVSSGTLAFSRPNDLDVNGVLSGGGDWSVQSGASISFPRSMTHLTDEVTWEGGSSTSVTRVDGGATFAPEDGQTNPPLTVTDGGTLLVGGTFNCSSVNLDGGILSTVGGTINGDITGLDNAVIQGVQNSTVTGSMYYASTTRQTYDISQTAPSQPALTSNSPVNIGGTLIPHPTATPTLGLSYPIVSSTASLSGNYEFVDHSLTPGRVKFVPSIEANTVSLTPTLTTYGTYEEWRVDNFSASDRLDPSISGKSADPDGDGLTNFQEYCHATAPRAFSPNPCTFIEFDDDDDDFRIEFPWAEGMTDASYSVEISNSLSAFAPATSTQTTLTGNDSVKTCSIRIEPVELVPGRVFVVVRAIEIPN